MAIQTIPTSFNVNFISNTEPLKSVMKEYILYYFYKYKKQQCLEIYDCVIKL